MDQEIREVRRVFRRAFQLARDARNRVASALSTIPVQAYYGVSFLATLSVLLHAYVTHEQFYPAITFLMSSKLAVMVLDVQFVVLAYLFLKLTIWAFFGPLSAIEQTELYESSWYQALDCLMLVTLVKGEITHSFALEAMMLIITKALIFINNLRVDAQSVALETSRRTHTKLILAILTSMFTSMRLGKLAYNALMLTGSTHQLVLGIEHILSLSKLAHISFKYGVFMYSRTHAGFYRKDEYLKAAEVLNYFVHFGFYLMMISYLSLYDMLPLFLLKNVYQSLRDFTLSFDTWRRARNAIQAIESSLFDITNEQLTELEDRTCAICRDEMTPSTRQKRLTCGHCFHLQCVRDWFRRAPSCPTCRADVIRPPPQPQNQQEDPNGQRRGRNGSAREEGAAALGRIPPEVVEMLNRLARLANEAAGEQANNEGLRHDREDYNIHISVTQHSYMVPAGGAPAPTPPPIPRTVLDSMAIEELITLSDSMTQSLQARNDWTRTVQAQLLNDHRSIVQGIDEVQNIIGQIFTRINEVRQADLPAEELELLTAHTERLQQLVRDVQRIAESAEETSLRGFASSTRTVGTQCPVRQPVRQLGRLFSDGELSRRRMLAQRNLIDMGRPIGRSVSDDVLPPEFRMRRYRAATEPPPSIWDTFMAPPPPSTPPPSLYVPSIWEGPSVEHREDRSSIWSVDSPDGLSQETYIQALNSTAGSTPFVARDDAQERLRQRRIARFMEEE